MIDKNFDTYTKIVGVTKDNEKGTNIQDLLPLLSEGGRLILKILNYTVKIKSEEGNFYYFEYDLITGESKIY